MQILHYLECIDRSRGGVVTAGMDMCEALLAHGVDVDLLTGVDVDAPQAWRDGAVDHLNLMVDDDFLCRFRPPVDVRQKVRPLLEKADVLHLHGVWNPLHRFLAAEAVAMGKPYVVTLHGMMDYWSVRNGGPLKRLKKQVYLKMYGAKILRQAAAVQTTAQLEADAVLSFVPGLRTVVLPYIFKPEGMLDIVRGAIPAEPSKPRLLFLSRIHIKKRPDLMIDLAAALPEVEVVMVGPLEPEAYGDELRAQADRLGVADRVVWAGMLRGAEKAAIFADTDIFVLPTSQENFGIVLAEAMAAQMPVVTTKGTAIWKDLEGAGAWIVGQDVAELTAAVREILDHPDQTQDRALQGKRWVEDTLLADALAPRYLQLYERLAAETAASRSA